MDSLTLFVLLFVLLVVVVTDGSVYGMARCPFPRTSIVRCCRVLDRNGRKAAELTWGVSFSFLYFFIFFLHLTPFLERVCVWIGLCLCLVLHGGGLYWGLLGVVWRRALLGVIGCCVEEGFKQSVLRGG